MRALLAFLFILPLAHGWIFNERRIDPHAEVTDECLAHAARGTCGFYECLEARFPCGHSGYSYRVGNHFCTKIVSMYDQLNPAGLQWINGTARCLANKLLPLYTSPFLRCGDIRDTGASAMVECNDRTESDGTDFCWFVRENVDFYSSVFSADDIGRIFRLGPRVVAKVVGEAVTCGASVLNDRAASFTSSVTDLWQNFVDRIDQLWPWD